MKKISKTKTIAFTVGAGVLLTACGGGDVGWEEEYLAEIEAEYADLAPLGLAQACSAYAEFTDQEIAAELLASAGSDGGGLFGGLAYWEEDGNEPTKDDYDKAADLAVKTLREECE